MNPTAPAPAYLSTPGALDALAPDLVAVLVDARPHPDIVIPRPMVTVAAMAAAARAAGAEALRWDGPGQRLTS